MFHVSQSDCRLALLLAAAGLVLRPGLVAAQAPHAHSHDAGGGHTHSHGGDDHAGHNHGAEIVAYRLPQGKDMHFDNPQQAAQHLAAVQQLGCEASQHAHGGHTDVSYRCREWKTVPVATHELAHQWEGWMQASGFDTFHAHIAPNLLQGPEVVELRLTEWKSLHAEGPQAAQLDQVINSLRAAGCEVAQQPHGNHVDIRYRCPIWTQIRVATHPEAEQWMAFLKTHGFETRHEH